MLKMVSGYSACKPVAGTQKKQDFCRDNTKKTFFNDKLISFLMIMFCSTGFLQNVVVAI